MSEATNTVQAPPEPQAKPASSLHMVATMGGVGFLAGLLIVLTYQVTLPIIKKNKAEVLQRAVFEVLPGATKQIIFTVDGNGEFVELQQDDDKAVKYYVGYNENDELVGVAIEASGQGFQDILRILYGYSPDKEAVIGMKVLETKETPGLGDKIEKDEHYLKNFEALDVSLTDNKNQLKNPIEAVKPGEKTAAHQIDTISGATISSKAIATILKESTKNEIPLIAKNLSKLKNPN